jgi:hypothetical protein
MVVTSRSLSRGVLSRTRHARKRRQSGARSSLAGGADGLRSDELFEFSLVEFHRRLVRGRVLAVLCRVGLNEAVPQGAELVVRCAEDAEPLQAAAHLVAPIPAV